MELLFILGAIPPVALVPASRQTPAQTVRATGETGPARSDGAEGRGYQAAREG
jgi:hypothetical protein